MRTLLVPERDAFGLQARILFVFCGYHGDHGSRDHVVWRVGRRLRLTSIVENARRVRDYYANPRSFDYLFALAREFRAANGMSSSVHALIDPKLAPATDAHSEPAFVTVEVMPDAPYNTTVRQWCERHAGRLDAIVLLYADAIGLGCAPLQRAALAAAPQVFVVNGRRRAFVLDRAARRALAWRRFLSNWRFVEIGLAVAFLVVAVAGLAVDKLRPKGN